MQNGKLGVRKPFECQRDLFGVFSSELPVLSVVQNRKLEVGKPRSLIKVPWRKLRGFNAECSALQNGKLRVKNLGKLILEVSELSKNFEFSTSPKDSERLSNVSEGFIKLRVYD